jgi:hypothetical protein
MTLQMPRSTNTSCRRQGIRWFCVFVFVVDGAVAACGGRALSTGNGNEGGIDHADGGRDATMGHPDAAADAFTQDGDSILTDATDSAPDVLEDVPDVYISPPHDFPYEACAPFPCEAGQFCAEGKLAACLAIPSECEPHVECSCIVRGAPWCGSMAACMEDAGEVTLNCGKSGDHP